MEQGQVSMTARRVAAQRLRFARVATDFGHPEGDQLLQADVSDGLRMPTSGLTAYLRRRTAYFDRVVADSIAGSLAQIVSIGSGYDGRSLRYDQMSVRWFEVDHPDTQRDKQERLGRLGLGSPRLTFVPADITVTCVHEALQRAGHDASAPSLFLCEGVAMYLAEAELATMLSATRRAAAAGSRLAIELALTPESEEDASRRLLLGQAVGGMGEPLRSEIKRDQVPVILEATGWSVLQAVDPVGVHLADSNRSAAFVLAHPS